MGAVLLGGGCLEARSEGTRAAQEPEHPQQHHGFSYVGEGGASAWAEESVNSLCDIDRVSLDDGQTPVSHQSPIALEPAGNAECGEGGGLTSIDYGPSTLKLGHNGHALIAELTGRDDVAKPTNRIVVDGVGYDLVQFHIHTPSEHLVSAQESPLELHLVHKAADGSLAVIGVMAEVVSYEDCDLCADKPIVDAFLEELPEVDASSHEPSGLREFPGFFNPEALLPPEGLRAGWTYDGSLTTPPCTEGVKWTVLETPLLISQRQLDDIQGRMESDAGLLPDGSPRLPGGFNARRHTDEGRASPLPPANGRIPRACPGPAPALPAEQAE